MNKPEESIKDKNERAIGIAEALGNFAERVSKKPHLHWYMDFDKQGNVTMFPEEVGLPLQAAVKRTVDTIKKAVELRSKNKLTKERGASKKATQERKH